MRTSDQRHARLHCEMEWNGQTQPCIRFPHISAASYKHNEGEHAHSSASASASTCRPTPTPACLCFPLAHQVSPDPASAKPIVLPSAGVHCKKSPGRQVWAHPLPHAARFGDSSRRATEGCVAPRKASSGRSLSPSFLSPQDQRPARVGAVDSARWNGRPSGGSGHQGWRDGESSREGCAERGGTGGLRAPLFFSRFPPSWRGWWPDAATGLETPGRSTCTYSSPTRGCEGGRYTGSSYKSRSRVGYLSRGLEGEADAGGRVRWVRWGQGVRWETRACRDVRGELARWRRRKERVAREGKRKEGKAGQREVEVEGFFPLAGARSRGRRLPCRRGLMRARAAGSRGQAAANRDACARDIALDEWICGGGARCCRMRRHR